MKLTDHQRSQLKAAAAFGGAQIDKVAAALQRENPDAFWRESELSQRNFFHEPMSYGFVLPHSGFVERFIPRRRENEYGLEQRQVMAQNHYLTTTYQIGVGA